MTDLDTRILDAAKVCRARWGIDRVTIDDIAAEAGVSRATLYRQFPGGREVLFEALRVRELEMFFSDLRQAVAEAITLEDLLVDIVVWSTRALRDDEHLAISLATEPGVAVTELTVEGLPRIVRVAHAFIIPLVEPFLEPAQARQLIDVLARVVISYFLAPSEVFDLGDEASARRFIAPFLNDALTVR
jgi:AcrR family transcriptional regulator